MELLSTFSYKYYYLEDYVGEHLLAAVALVRYLQMKSAQTHETDGKEAEVVNSFDANVE